jgi:hypothetical protein
VSEQPVGRQMQPVTETHPSALSGEDLVAQCRFRRTRRSGPGGQHRNKVETAVVVTHEPSGVTAEANERRSQHENRRVAVFRLRVNLALQVRCPRPLTAPPSPCWQGRCRASRIAVHPDHDDFPLLLAEALDTLLAYATDISAAAQSLRVTPTQLIKLLKQEPRALAQVNRVRQQNGLHALR